MKKEWSSHVAGALCAQMGEPDPEVAIRKLILEKLAGLGNGTLPVNLEAICEELGIEKIKEEECPGAGYLCDTGEHCWIGVNLNDTEQRRRFTIAHEIVHFMLPTHKIGTHSDADPGSFSRGSEEEYLCDLGASFLLIPREQFDSLVKKALVTSGLISKVGKLFDVSLEAAIVTVCTRIQAAFLVAKWRRNDNGFMLIEGAYRSSTIGREFWLPPHSKESPTHPIAHLSEGVYGETVNLQYLLKQSDRRIYMEADYLSLGNQGSPVLSVLRPIAREKWKFL